MGHKKKYYRGTSSSSDTDDDYERQKQYKRRKMSKLSSSDSDSSPSDIIIVCHYKKQGKKYILMKKKKYASNRKSAITEPAKNTTEPEKIIKIEAEKNINSEKIRPFSCLSTTKQATVVENKFSDLEGKENTDEHDLDSDCPVNSTSDTDIDEHDLDSDSSVNSTSEILVPKQTEITPETPGEIRTIAGPSMIEVPITLIKAGEITPIAGPSRAEVSIKPQKLIQNTIFPYNVKTNTENEKNNVGVSDLNVKKKITFVETNASKQGNDHVVNTPHLELTEIDDNSLTQINKKIEALSSQVNYIASEQRKKKAALYHNKWQEKMKLQNELLEINKFLKCNFAQEVNPGGLELRCKNCGGNKIATQFPADSE